jgi:hypothetical protein
MTNATARSAFAFIEKSLASWDRQDPREEGEEGWPGWFGVDREDAEAEVLRSWDKIRILVGGTPLDSALKFADECPLGLRPELKECRSTGYPRFISMAAYLQVGRGNDHILLPCDDVSKLLGVTAMTVSRYRAWAVEDGYLTVVKPHEPYRGKKPTRATEFRFDLSKFPNLQKRSQRGGTPPD